ncbi:MAG: hypothetical protein ACLFRX_06235 [Gemmatimonadota bacterium]
MKRTVVLLGALALAACQDLGLEENVSLADAKQAPLPELLAAVMEPVAESPRIIVDGKLWVPDDRPRALREEELRTVGSADGRTVYAPTWDRPPYDRLFTRVEDPARDPLALNPGEARWQAYLPVIGGGAPRGQRSGAATPAR